MWLGDLQEIYVDSDESLVKKKTFGKSMSLGDVLICMKDADAYRKMSWWNIVTKVTFFLKGSYEYVYLDEICVGLLIMRKDVWSLEMIQRKVTWHNGGLDKEVWWITFW